MTAPKDPTSPPKNGVGYWVYVDDETKVEIKHPYFDQVRREVRAHRLANSLPVGVDWLATFSDNVCRNTPGSVCVDTTPPIPLTPFELAKSLGSALINWAKAGFRVVSDETFNQRHAICTGCDYWMGDGASIGLCKCGKCGCSGLKLFLPTEKCPIRKW